MALETYRRNRSFKGNDSAASTTRHIARERPASVFTGRGLDDTAQVAESTPGAGVSAISLSHPDRLVYPDLGISKGAVARYYQRVAPLMLPHLVGRPLTLLRCPRGQGQACFFQRHVQRGLTRPLVPVPIKADGKEALYVSIEDADGLTALVQMGVLEIHTWGARSDQPEAPDRIVFDLDPDTELPWSTVTQAAEELRERLARLALRSFVKTTGGKGLHVLVPVSRDPERFGWEQAMSFCKKLAQSMESDTPHRYLARSSKAKRKGRIFIDYLRNAHGATTIAPYSTRARANAALAVPLDWRELGLVDPERPFTLANIDRRVRELSKDPWEDVTSLEQRIDTTLLSRSERV